MSGWLGGGDADLALDFGADALSFGALRRAVGSARLPGGPIVPAPSELGAAGLIVTVLAALDRGRPVFVGGTAAEAGALGPLPTQSDLLLLTSGSSGRARPVARSNASWLASAEPLTELTGLRRHERVAVTGPLHVSMHLYGALHALRAGASVGDNLAGAALVHATPTRLRRLLDAGHAPRGAVVAGAPLSPGLVQRARTCGTAVREYYGAAELSFVATGTGDGLEAFPGVELDLRDGVLWARSPYLAHGYAAGSGPFRRGEDGFASVGDRAEPLAGGRIRVRGRGDGAITTAGATVQAEEIEEALERVPGVRAAAVLGEPDALLGERIVALVELGEGGDLSRVERAARALLSPEERPRRWVAVDALPLTANGKLARGMVAGLLR